MATIDHVVVLIQENHTTDNYFRSMAAFGANVATGWPVSPNPPASDQAHDRKAYYQWLTKKSTGAHVQFDTVNDLPFYAWLAASGTFIENHCAGYGTNSTPNHLLLLGGQTPTLKNPSGNPEWDMPSVLGLAGDHGVTWKAYTGSESYPVAFYTQLKGSPNIGRSADIITDAQGGKLPTLSMVWHQSPLDEHPPANVTQGMDAIWQIVDAIRVAGLWDSTVFMLTWDDWGGYDDHVATPNVEITPDGVQLAYGPRVPLLMFGGRVKPGIDHRWSWHPSIPKTVIQLLGLPALGIARVDNDKGLADLVDTSSAPTLNPPPPAHGTTIVQPAPPQPPPVAVAPPPPPVSTPQPVGPILLRNGNTLPPPNDAPLP